jgi:hypothetical protein
VIVTLSVLPQLCFASALAESSRAGKGGSAQQWSVQVDKIDSGDVKLEPSFGAAIYENFLEQLARTKQFNQVLRSGDRNANDVPDLLILKTSVQKYTPGSETRRAVTTVTGATKLNVRIQLFTRDGHVVLEHVVEGDVRFIGNNLRATHNLAHNVAAILKRSTLPHAPGATLRTVPQAVSPVHHRNRKSSPRITPDRTTDSESVAQCSMRSIKAT